MIWTLQCDSIESVSPELVKASLMTLTMEVPAGLRLGMTSLMVNMVENGDQSCTIELNGTKMTGIPRNLLRLRHYPSGFALLEEMMYRLNDENKDILADLPTPMAVVEYDTMLQHYDAETSEEAIRSIKQNGENPKGWNKFVRNYGLQELGWTIFAE